MKKIAVLLAEGYEEGESLFLIDILRRGKLKCDSISVSGDSVVTGGCLLYTSPSPRDS